MLKASKLTAADIMTRDVVTVFPQATLREVAGLLAKHKISGVPVIDDDRHVVGFVTENDLLQFSETPDDKQAWWLNMLADGFELAPEFLTAIKSGQGKVRSVMKTDVVSVTPTTSVSEIARLIVAKSIKRVPVVDEGKLVGVVSRADLVQAMAHG